MENIIEIKNVTKIYKNKNILKNITLKIDRESIYGLIGKNGAGKTTLLKIICGLIKVSSGIVKLDNDLRIGSLIENPGLLPNLTAFDNIKIKCIAYGIDDTHYIEDLLNLIGLKYAKDIKIKQFSLGMKQRLGIALALVGNPDILVLDEPINGLDPQGIVEVRNLLIRLNKEKHMTIIISSHILEELSKIVTDYGIINNGKLMISESKSKLQNRCITKYEILSKEKDTIKKIFFKENIEFNNDTIKIATNENIEKVLDANLKYEYRLKVLKKETLEEVYLRIIGGDHNEKSY
ncbi:ATP-binding cassette domain-containing protein [Eubacterium multiforme]|uniref:ABC-2 type transport system ATP-binding protein n=1 Tax=Eubacterium multiforme TaxID=83339 RepID=A0ABT9UTI7_9FIRM|nr:ATP-binding cassette domain-containing protein [Eubacterium multiforme]MDQ0149653.1 ABC-2 type transport system ATP-binding protein [Eubacterium multiforme]